MAVRRFEARIRHQPQLSIIDLDGEINAQDEEALNAAYTEATKGQPDAVLLNFKDVSYINSTGIALVVGLLAQSRKSGRKLLTCGLSEHYRKIFEITRLSDFMGIYNDERDAVSSFVTLTSQQRPSGGAQ